MNSFIRASALHIPLHDYSAQLVYCDPPTNRGMNEGSSPDKRSGDDYRNFCLQWLREAMRCMSTDSWLVICLYHRIRYMFEKLLDEYSDLKYSHEVIWDYNFGLYTRHAFVPSHDNILIYKQGRPVFNWQPVAITSQRMESNDPRADWRGRTPGSVWHISRVPGNSKDRMYMKDIYKRSCQPVELCTRVIKALTHPHYLVLDLFSGSGSMAVACQQNQREYVGIDICKHYLEESKERTEDSPRRKFMDMK